MCEGETDRGVGWGVGGWRDGRTVRLVMCRHLRSDTVELNKKENMNIC